MTSNTIVRPAGFGDVEQIRSVAAASWATAYAGIIPPEAQNRALAAWYETEAIRSAMTESGAVFLVALSHGVVVGFIHLGPARAGKVELLRMYVLPRNARQGVGTRLLEAAVSAYESHGVRIVVAVAERNASGRAFYEKSGFVLTGTRSVDVFGASIAEVTYIRRLEGGAG